MRAAVRAIDPEQPIADVRTMEQWVARSLQNRRTNMTLLTIFGAVALVLSAIGIYGVLAFGVAQRVREFGIRQALGADRSSILSLVLKQGLRTAGVGMVLGLAASVALSRLLQTLLFGVTPRDFSVLRRRARSCCSWSRWPPATSPRAAPRGSIRWSRCAIRDAGGPSGPPFQPCRCALHLTLMGDHELRLP